MLILTGELEEPNQMAQHRDRIEGGAMRGDKSTFLTCKLTHVEGLNTA